MKIFVKETLASPGQKKRSTLSGKSILKKIKNRRKARKDRRRSANNGVLVELSNRIERRISRERRNKAQTIQDFVTISKMLFHSGLTFLVP